MANEVEFSFLEPQDLMTKTTYDSNTDNVVEVAQDIAGFDTASDNTFYGKVGGVTGFYTVPAGAQAINDLTDVDTSGIGIGQVLQYNGTSFVPFTITDQIGATILDELGDVDTTTTAPTNGDALIFDGTNFVPQAVSGGGASVISDLTDVDTTGVVANNVLKYDGTNWVDGSIAYSELTGTPTLAPVATSGDYSDLTGTPTLATVATTGSYTDLLNQPTIPSNINDLGDVDTTGITNGQVLQYNGTSFVAATISGGGASALDDLSDVDTTTTSPTNGDALVFDGTNFVPQAVSGSGATNLNELTDVDTTGAITDNVLKFDGTTWVDGSVSYSELTGTPTLAVVATSGDYNDLSNLPSIPVNVNDLGDVDTTGITSGQVLQYNGTSFVPFTITDQIGATILDELGDVDTTTTAPTNGDALVFDGTNFVPQAVSGGASAINDLTDVDTTGVVTNNVLKYDGTSWVDGSVAYSELTGTPTLAPVATSGAYSDLSGTPTLSTVATTGSYTDLLDQPTIPSNIEELSNVDTTGVVVNNVLKFDGTNWVNGSVDYSEVSNTPNLSTVATSGSYNDLSNLPVLSTVATSGSYTDLVNTPSIPSSINDLSDVDTSGITNGQVLQFDGTSFVAATISGGSASTLNDLTDVDTNTTAPTTGDTLVYNGTEWVPQAPSGGGSSVTTIERFRINFNTDDTVAGTVGTSDAYSEITSGITPVLTTAGSSTNVETTITFNGYNFPPANIMLYGYDAANDRFVMRALNTSIFVESPNNSGDVANPDVFGGFQSLTMDTTATSMGVTHKTGFGSTAGWGYIVFVMQG